jgi:hypothetical protein
MMIRLEPYAGTDFTHQIFFDGLAAELTLQQKRQVLEAEEGTALVPAVRVRLRNGPAAGTRHDVPVAISLFPNGTHPQLPFKIIMGGVRAFLDPLYGVTSVATAAIGRGGEVAVRARLN